MKAPQNISVYRKIIPKGEEINLKKEPWMPETHREDYLSFLDGILNLDSDVLEFGSGGSSLYIAKKAKSLTTFEHDKIWYKIVREEIAKEGISNITIHFNPDYSKTFCCVKPCFDIATVDIWCEPARERLIEVAMNCLRLGGYLIFHNHICLKKLKKENWTLLKNWGDWKVAWRKSQ